jgi:hypothetical protein
MGTSLWVAFDDGRCAPVLPDELSPLPAAPIPSTSSRNASSVESSGMISIELPRTRPGDVTVSANNGDGVVTFYMPREKVTQREKALAEDTMKLITNYLRSAAGTPERQP